MKANDRFVCQSVFVFLSNGGKRIIFSYIEQAGAAVDSDACETQRKNSTYGARVEMIADIN